MAEQLSRRMVLLAAYEDFTRRETVSLRDDKFELMLKLQDKKAKVLSELDRLQDLPDASETESFNSRISILLKQEEENEKLLELKKAVNRQEYRKLSQNAVSANKLRRAYSAPVDRSIAPGSLKGKA